LIGCAAPGCTGGIAQYADLANGYNYFVITTIGDNANGGTQDDFVLDSITFENQVAEPPPSRCSASVCLACWQCAAARGTFDTDPH